MERIYYDGECGFCHGWVRFAVRADADGTRFRFAPLQGTTFASRVPPGRRAGMRSTFVVETGDGRLLVRSDAVIHVLRSLGRRRAAATLALLPRPVRDLGYRAVALLRRALAPRPWDACPVADHETRRRFDP